MLAQDVEFLGDLRAGLDIAGICVAGHQAQRLLLAAAGDNYLRVLPSVTLRHLRRIESAFDPIVLAVERLVVPMLAAPHLQADLHRLLQHLEAFRERRVSHPQALRFVREVTRAYTQPCTTG